MFTRKDYLDGAVSHDDYYAQFVTDALVAYVVRTIGADSIKASTDEHMNDIPLARWDRLLSVSEYMDRDTFKACNNVTYAPEHRDKFLWSLSDQVCIAKRAAKAYKVCAAAVVDAKAEAKPASIGDVLVFEGEPEGGNPYRSHGSANPSLSGDARVLALRALRDGEDTSAWSYWFAPYCGGAVRITSPTEVRWDTAGSLTV